MQNLTPVLTDAATLRAKLHAKTVGALTAAFPLDLKGRTLELQDVKVHAQDFTPTDEYNALMKGSSLNEPVKGTLVLKGADGKVIDTAKNFTLTHLPFLTSRHTLISDGNEYQVANQLRRKPGVYTQRSDNGELKTVFNLGRGKNFDVVFNENKGTFHLQYGTSNLPLYAVLRGLGVSHEHIAGKLGEGVAKENEKEHGHQVTTTMAKLYTKLEHPALIKPTATHEEKVQAVKKRYDIATLDSDVTHATLGHAYDKVTPDVMLAAAKKILQVHKGERPVDDTDSLTFKTFHSMDDFIAERIRLTARAWSPKAKMALNGKSVIREALKPAPFSDSIKKFLTTSSLSAVPTGINPMEILDHSVKVTSLGEGGIPSDRAIPLDARMIHNTQFGALDPIRTPESSHSGVDIRATIAAHRDDKGNLYTVMRNVKTGKDEYIRSGDLSRMTVAFPHQQMVGKVDVFHNGEQAKVDASKVTHQLNHVTHIYSPATTLIPFIHSIQGNRAIMGSKMGTQALPLLEREAPLVQVRSHLPEGHSFEQVYGHMIVPKAPVSGTVAKIDKDYVYIRPHAEKKAEDRPVIEQKKLGPHTFNIEIKKDHLVPGNKHPSTADYGHLPGYTGPDGDSLDFFVGDHPHGVLAVFDKQKNFDGKGWVTTDKKFCVGMDPKEYAAWRSHPAMTSHPSIRFANEKHFKDWNHLQQHIDEHFKTPKTAADEKGLVKVPYHQFFPFPSKTYLHHDLGVKAGDTVKEGQRLGESNYTKNGTLALGKNLLVGYMPYYGFNSNDAVVISDACSKKLTSEHMYREVYPLSSQVELNKEKHRMYYGTKYQPDAYGKLDGDGVIKKGSRVNAKEPLVLGLTKQAIMGTDAMLGRISKALAKPYKEVTLIWDHGAPGEVIDVVRTNSQITVLVRTQERMQVGDKLAGRYGNKGVVAKIVPDHEMLQDEQGRPIDLLLTSAGVVSRINPAQVIETAVSKVAEKTGKPIVYDNAAGHNAVKWARDLMQTHGVKDKEHLFDPVLNRKIKGGDGKGVLVGRQFIYKLFKSTDTNFAGHGVGPYDLNEQPLKTGGDDSAKGIGKMEFDALLAHNARNFLREAATVKGQKNDEFWKAVQTGMPLPQPKPSFAFNKFTAMLEGAGIKVDKRGSKMTLMPLTDHDVTKRSAGVIENNKTIQSKNLRPEKGGLFDPIKTGGNQGTLYSHIDLHEPIPNPVFKDPVRRLLGLSEKEFDKAVHDHGGSWFHSELQKIDVPKKIQDLRGQMKTAKGPALNDIVKQVKSLEALQKNNMKPHEAYVISKIPVIPPVFRPILPGVRDPSQLMVADANKLYAQLMDSSDTLKRTALESDRGKHRLDVYNKVEELYGVTLPQDAKMQQQKVKGFLATIAGVGTPKGGFFQRKLMRHTQDVSGRGTAVPDANLNMDEVGVPEQMLWQMLDKLIVARLIRKGYPALQAREMVTKKDPTAHQAMLEEAKERPVWINRAPTLHRWGIIAAYAKPVQGKTLRVSPFIETGMNLDYDGDTLQVHVPVTPDAVHDAKNMTMTNLLLSDQQRNRLMAFPQHEAIIGFTHAAKNTEAKGPVKTFKNREDVLSAWRRGDLKMTDAIEVQNTKHAEETEADNYGLGEPLPAGFSTVTPEAALSYFPPENVTGVNDDQEEADVPLSR